MRNVNSLYGVYYSGISINNSLHFLFFYPKQVWQILQLNSKLGLENTVSQKR